MQINGICYDSRNTNGCCNINFLPDYHQLCAFPEAYALLYIDLGLSTENECVASILPYALGKTNGHQG